MNNVDVVRPVRLMLLRGFAPVRGAQEIDLPMSAQRPVALLALRERALACGSSSVLPAERHATRSSQRRQADGAVTRPAHTRLGLLWGNSEVDSARAGIARC